jgi:ATP-binding cassette subfamily B protein
VEQLGGLDYVRAANTYKHEVRRVARAAEKRRAREIRHHFQMSLFGAGKALNEGMFHILVLSLAIYWAIRGDISYGDILMFSMLFLNVMGPLSEVHRIIDEGHECSLRVGDLIDLLTEPADRSFKPSEVHPPRLEGEHPLLAVEDLRVEYTMPARISSGPPGWLTSATRSWRCPAATRPRSPSAARTYRAGSGSG